MSIEFNDPIVSLVVGALLSGFVTWKLAKWQARKDYQYKRSQHITEAKFEAEYMCLKELSGSLYRLIDAIKSGSAEDVARIREEVKSDLPASALPLFYLRTNSVLTTCGAKLNKPNSDRNLHQRAIEIIRLSNSKDSASANEENLIKKYEEFLICANCRLRSIELGTKDAEAKGELESFECLLLGREEAQTITFEDLFV